MVFPRPKKKVEGFTPNSKSQPGANGGRNSPKWGGLSFVGLGHSAVTARGSATAPPWPTHVHGERGAWGGGGRGTRSLA